MAKTKKKIKARGPRQEIRIDRDDGHVNVRRQKLKKITKEQATWISDTGERFIVIFNKPEGSPFFDDTYTFPERGEVSSGPFRKAWPTGDEFNCTVVGTAGVNHPVIIVDN